MELKTLTAYNNANNIDFGDTIVIFKFGCDWCAQCKKLNEIINDTPGTLLYNISVDEEFESYLMEKNIYSIPHCFLKYKKEIVQFKGEVSKDELLQLCSSIRKEM